MHQPLHPQRPASRYAVCLSVAGSDPSGGAGLQADLKTFAALGCYGAAAVTALTVQSTLGVERSVPVDASLVAEQMAAVLADLRPLAVKMGMTATAATVRAVASVLRAAGYKPFVVFDPVLISSSGLRLTDEEAVAAMKSQLMPLCDLVTPNLPEAQALTGLACPEAAARALLEATGCGAVLVKGGHRDGAPTDLLVTPQATTPLPGRRIATANTHGTGCTLSSAIAAFAARGALLPQAVASAKAYVEQALQAGADMSIGHGHGPLCHGFAPLPALRLPLPGKGGLHDDKPCLE